MNCQKRGHLGVLGFECLENGRNRLTLLLRYSEKVTKLCYYTRPLIGAPTFSTVFSKYEARTLNFYRVPVLELRMVWHGGLAAFFQRRSQRHGRNVARWKRPDGRFFRLFGRVDFGPCNGYSLRSVAKSSIWVCSWTTREVSAYPNYIRIRNIATHLFPKLD